MHWAFQSDCAVPHSRYSIGTRSNYHQAGGDEVAAVGQQRAGVREGDVTRSGLERQGKHQQYGGDDVAEQIVHEC